MDPREEGTPVIPPKTPSFDELLRQSQEACDALSTDDDGLKREILAHAGNRWSLGVVHALGVAGTLRHAALARRLDGVTQRMLTRTLRQLERDGLIVRHDHGEVPPRVDYCLSESGRGLLVGMLPLWRWVIDNAAGFRDARQRYDEKSSSKHPSPELSRRQE
ncbi:helix-turn-helix domain-containing protein [Pandoraea sp. SD6-2]|uniref:winged helix-turn-helix transcriptional regulator n=1 Tax=Pandoraea sp. SD6-2 TaxID=1286093 RepID=UPI00032E6ED0|nr:helix-turn-helix domain-containing protein [Pandoraea sp. SD6-2]EON13408.1 transcriptional regulator [Pandoraea sp. SD6-2]